MGTPETSGVETSGVQGRSPNSGKSWGQATTFFAQCRAAASPDLCAPSNLRRIRMLPRLAIGPSEQAVGRLVADDLMPYGTALTLGGGGRGKTEEPRRRRSVSRRRWRRDNVPIGRVRDRTVAPAPCPGLFVMDCGDPGLKPGATIHAPYRGAGTEAMKHPGREAINLGGSGGGPGVPNALNI